MPTATRGLCDGGVALDSAERRGAREPRPDQQAKIELELPDLIRAWMHRHKVRSLASAAARLGIQYHTFRNWSLGTRCPDGFTFKALFARLLE
jgi:hypothetical protein